MREGLTTRTPFFSVGVTTYRRVELLGENLRALRAQTFGDFEAIVGNDDVTAPLSGASVGIDDPRIRIVNHPVNLGEVRNMNALLGMARGRYFTWLADDDVYTPDFLHAVHATLVRSDFPSCVFTGFVSGPMYPPDPRRAAPFEARLMTGREFLRAYLARSLKTIGCYAVFEAAYLRSIGGIQALGRGSSLYADNLLAISSGVLASVAWIDAPLIFYRMHGGSISLTSRDLHAYASAQADLVERALPVLSADALAADLRVNLFMLLAWCVRDFGAVVRRAGGIGAWDAVAYLRFVERAARPLAPTTAYWRILRFTAGALVRAAVAVHRSKARAAVAASA